MKQRLTCFSISTLLNSERVFVKFTMKLSTNSLFLNIVMLNNPRQKGYPIQEHLSIKLMKGDTISSSFENLETFCRNSGLSCKYKLYKYATIGLNKFTKAKINESQTLFLQNFKLKIL